MGCNCSSDQGDRLNVATTPGKLTSDYTLGEFLGEGNYAKVYGVTKKSNGNEYAVKRVIQEKLIEEEDRVALVQEIDILRMLDHPNIVHLYDFYQDSHHYDLVLELMSGGELFKQLDRRGKYNERDARNVVKQIAEALAYSHSKGVAHRDLKPENILLMDDSTTIKIADFGFAKVTDAEGLRTPCGTPGYVAPEILSRSPYGTEVDMWSLGVITYILLCGYPPFYDESQGRLFRMIKRGRYSFDEEFWGGVSQAAKDCIKKLLTVNRARRYTAAELLRDPWITDDTLPDADLTSALTQLRKFNARRKWRAAITGVRALQAMNKFIATGQKSLQESHAGARPAAAAATGGGEAKAEEVQVELAATADDDDEELAIRFSPGSYAQLYTQGAELGKGNYATVYKCVENATGAEFAVKVIKRSTLSSEDEEGLVQEVAVLQEVDHPNVISLKGVYESGDYFYLVTELVTGGELLEDIVAREFYSEADAQRILRTLAQALQYLHARGILHRDMKPENMLLDAENAIKLADFGFAKKLTEAAPVTRTPCGTPGYVAPEVLRQRPYDSKVDMWSLGVIAYILLAGYPPFDHPNQSALFKLIKHGTYEFHDEYWSEVSQEAKDMIRKLLTVDPRRRYSATQLLEDPWLASVEAPTTELTTTRQALKKFNAKRKWRKALHGVRAVARMRLILAAANAAADDEDEEEGGESKAE